MDSATSEPRRIDGPLPCVKCLYDLAGLMSDQKCPECGTAIARTLESPDHRIVRHQERLRRSLMLIAVSMIGGNVWFVAAHVASALFVYSGRTLDAAYLAGFSVFAIIASTLTVLSARGWHGLYQSCSQSWTLVTWRSSLLPLCAWLFAGCFSASAALASLPFVFGHNNYGPPGWGEIGLAVGATAAWCLRTVIGIGIAAELAMWLGRKRLATVLRLLRWTGPALLILSMVIVFYINTVDSPLLEAPGLVVLLVYGLANILAGITLLVVRRRLWHFAAAAAQREFAKSLSAPATQDTLAI